jgi:hypothetical protein
MTSPFDASPRALAARFERDPRLPDGAGDRFVGYGALGLTFASGHVLALRRWTASSLGAPYASVWHRTPEGAWRFLANAPPDLACTRYTSAIAAESHHTEVAVEWTASDALRIGVPAVGLRWSLRLRAIPATHVFATVRPWLRERWLASDHALVALGAIAGTALGAGTIRLVGRMPNGQRYRVVPHAVWEIADVSATIDGVSLDAIAVPRVAPSVGDFQIPRRPLFAFATARFQTVQGRGSRPFPGRVERRAPPVVSPIVDQP